ncbi:MAG: glutamate racemase [Desulforegulaceae bacterium]|jgi:glutamate racemase|nr:glutamate racemase [Desulforegulaceae bacterium]
MIGIFDSGIGGLTTVKAITDRLPHADILYFGDTARTPYGSKSADTIRSYSVENGDFLIKKGAKIIIIACNTASSAATDLLRQRYDIPVFEVITPAVELAVQTTRNKKIGIIGTRATISSGIYERNINLLDPEIKVLSNSSPLLVPLIEEGFLDTPETKRILKKYLIPLKTRQIDTLILGCTHYPILKKLIAAKAGKRVKIIDSSTAIAQSVVNFIDSHENGKILTGSSGKRDFYVSDITPQFGNLAKNILKAPVDLIHREL